MQRVLLTAAAGRGGREGEAGEGGREEVRCVVFVPFLSECILFFVFAVFLSLRFDFPFSSGFVGYTRRLLKWKKI